MASTFKMDDGDITINAANGRPTLISGAAKTSQDIKEFFTIEILPNGFGAGIEQLVAIVEVSANMFVSVIDTQIRDGLAVFIGLIRNDPRIPRIAAERIIGASNIQVSVDPLDPTKFYFSVNILTENGLSTQFTNIFSTP